MYNSKLQDILKNNEYYAHIGNSDSKKESLLSHLELTLEYYKKLNKKKNLEKIFRNIIKNINNKINKEVEDKIYEMFLNAIYYHDIGKINPKFQIYKMKNGRVEKDKNIIDSNHSMLSAKIYIDTFKDEILKTRNQDYIIVILFIYYFGFAISRHHSFIDMNDIFLEELEKVKIPAIYGNIDFNKDKELYLISAIKEKYEMDKISIYILVKLVYSIIITADYYATYDFMSGNEIKFEDKNIDLFENYKESELYKKINLYKVDKSKLELSELNKIRNEIFVEAESNLKEHLKKSHIFYLESPTGSGKTNISINLAKCIYEECEEINSINYIFPFNTLIEQTQGVFESYFDNNKDFVVINSITPIYENNEEDTDYERIYIDNLFRNYPITITSHVNLFDSLFGTGKENNFSLLDYCNSVIILDEIQTYKNRIWREILIMLEKYAELLNIKIIIMSATLPNLSLLSIENHIKNCNLIGNTKRYYDSEAFKKRVQISYELLERKITFEDLKKEVLKHKDRKVMVEFIKKQDARDFYNLLKDEDLTLYEISGDDNNYERKKILNKIAESKALILVCTQVIEAGVDIDMDVGFKDISFLDSEEQFLGRINRNNTKNGCKAYFFNYANARTIYRDDRREGLDLTRKDLQSVLIEKDFNQYFDMLLEKVKKETMKYNKDNINDFMENCGELRYSNIKNKLTLIDEQHQQIFLNFTYNVDGEEISGKEIWEKYCSLYENKEMSFAEKKIKLSQLKRKMSIFIYTIPSYEKNLFFTDSKFGMLYIENGEDFLENGKFNRKKYLEYGGGKFI